MPSSAMPVRSTAWIVLSVGLAVAYLSIETSIHRSLIVLTIWSVATLMIRGSVMRWSALAAVAIVGAAAVADVPQGTVLWFYQSYGRIVEEYRANPYVVAPAEFVGDSVIDRTSSFYRDTASIYGPAFVVGAAVVSALSGTDELAGRLAWQGLAFAAAIMVLALLRRMGVPWDRVLLVGLSPGLVYLLINQAHNDVFIGVLILGGVVLVDRDRFVAASALFALAALVKAPAGIALVTYLVWLVARGERRNSLMSAAVAGSIGLVLTAPFGIGAVLGPLSESRGTTNATSLWNLLRGDVLAFVWRPERTIDTMAGPLVSLVGMLIPVVIAIWAALHFRHRPLHEPLTIALLAWVVFSLYSSVWLSGWFIALAGLWGAREARLLVGYSSLLLVTSQSWLMPVATIVDRGSYGLVERSAALLLGVTTISGVGLVAYFLRREQPEYVS